MTALLAQRLDELALANKDGLLSDDEYRLLRQSAFERFTQDGQADLPREAHVVPVVSLQVPQLKPYASNSLPETRAASPHRVEFSPHSPRPHSMISMKSDAARSANGSVRGKAPDRHTMAGLMRRATSRRRLQDDKPPKDEGKRSNRFVSGLSKLLSPRKEQRSKSTDSGTRRGPPSILTKRDASPGSPGKAARRTAGPSEPSSPTSPVYPTSSNTRPSIFSASTHASSKGSLFSLGSPIKSRKPSSTTTPSPTKAIGSRMAITPELLASILTDETNLADARPADIRRAIDGVEDERRVVLDAFEGLEMSVLARVQRAGHPARRASVPFQRASSPSRLSVAPPSHAARMRANSSPRRPTHMRTRVGSTAGRSHMSARQDSITSMASVSAPAGGAVAAESVDADEDGAMNELEDVRRRRAEVIARYEARLEYLRALMKGAEIRERARR